ncbi:KIF-binding protein-like [Saccoglossus kowalevskii]|uniref:KIF-binding protein n=1 Tax=Saccoglossus kowalevskii TaxID=10224 RepID=A0ABM0GU34_SACKO|nr:PREDICTED: KIF1-binding protein homolog [Saccoglossus kowalevskii]
MAASMDNLLGSEEIAKFDKARKLSEEIDPETQPYKSKYEAREILLDLKSTVQALLNENEEIDDVKFMLATLEYQLGLNFIECEELSSGEEHLNKCLLLLKDNKANTKCISTVLASLNQLGILWSARSEFEKSFKFFQSAESLYKDYCHNSDTAPYSLNELFLSDDDRLSEHQRHLHMEKLHTLTLYYLAQIYGKLDDKDKSAMYCHTTLQRQLETKQYDAIDWAVNCATLSQYYLTADNFTQARHCLASASHIFSEALETYVQKDPSEISENEEDDPVQYRKADIARCWTKYCILLLQTSKDKLQSEEISDEATERREQLLQECESDRQSASATSNDNRDDGAGEETKTNEAEGAACEEKEDVEEKEDNHKDAESEKDMAKLSLRFQSLELTSLESAVSDKLVTSFEEARSVFLVGQKYILEAKEYYVIDGHVTDNISIVQDHSHLFKLLAFFEPDLERQCKMHKRRLDMLQDVLQDLNSQHYLAYCRQLQYEMAETYSGMVDLKISLTEVSNQRITPHAISKINSLISQSIKMYETFIESLKSPDGVMPEKLEDDLVKPTLVAYFCMGRLLSKYITIDLDTKLEFLDKSIEKYRFVVNYLNKNTQFIGILRTEYEICQEMISLVPLKMELMKKQSTIHPT